MTQIIDFPIQFRPITPSDSPQEAIRLAKLKVSHLLQEVEAGRATLTDDQKQAIAYINELCEKYDQPKLEI